TRPRAANPASRPAQWSGLPLRANLLCPPTLPLGLALGTGAGNWRWELALGTGAGNWRWDWKRAAASPSLWFDNLVADGITHETRGRGQIEFPHDRRAMGFHRLEADVENVGDLLVRVTFSDQLHHATFAVGQRRSLPRRSREKRIEQGLGNL